MAVFTSDDAAREISLQGLDIKIPQFVPGTADEYTSIERGAFLGRGIRSVTIPNNIKSIGVDAFVDNRLTRVVIGKAVETLPFDQREKRTRVFGGNPSFHLEILDGAASIGEAAFGGAALKSVFIPSSVVSIEGFAFSSTGLKSVQIPVNVKTIAGKAFAGNQRTDVRRQDGRRGGHDGIDGGHFFDGDQTTDNFNPSTRLIRGTDDSDELAAVSGSRSIMEGGGSADTFVMSPEDVYSRQTADFIIDFSQDDGDKIALPMNQLGMAAVRFKAVKNKKDAKKFFSRKHSLVYDIENGYLYLDLNGRGNGLGKGGVLASFDAGTSLSKDDLLRVTSGSGAPNLTAADSDAVPNGSIPADITDVFIFPSS
jgi:hypothetical protein